MIHANEIAAGRLIPPEGITVYRCARNHLCMIHGPHVYCTCGMIGWDLAARGMIDGGVNRALVWAEWGNTHISVCICGAGFKKLVYKAGSKPAAEAVALLSGLTQARAVINKHAIWTDTKHWIPGSVFLDLPVDFPPRRPDR